MTSIDRTLSSWQPSQTRDEILSFLSDVTTPESEHFVPEVDRVAVFDNDGTLWVEKPLLAQLAYFRDQIRPDDDPPRAQKQRSLFERAANLFEDAVVDLFDDVGDLLKDLIDGVTTDEFKHSVLQWMARARHPRFQVPYTQVVYQPMLEILALFRQHRFDCYIVTGASSDFVRPWCGPVYQVPEPNVIGSSLRTRLVERNDQLQLEYLPMPFAFTNGDGKVEAIARRIGKQPIAAFGNSHGDVDMLRWTSQAKRALCCLVHHTDSVREYEYSPDPAIHFGPSTLELADRFGWHLVDMKADWRRIFAHDTPSGQS
ncbi:HAD family hydrolase [Reinekea blandensis]|uniref:NapD-like protein n=1 Tax=Reinekea blandensis MED297 TaxID=314283 RepID=A4BKA0_9GAMM|nr:HAD family hydrolase [Reinekea blandensis]EAR07467.1 NapD-like protein [Reinekea sp. MED297] [Reinekea blandensis MED297]